MLPGSLPVSPRARIAARYVPAGRAEHAGGDWFDAVLRDDGTIAATVGDVIGSGAGAATAMGQLRSALTAATLHGLGILDTADLYERIDEYARVVPNAVGTTACTVLTDPASGELRYASAGHAPPLVVRADGTAGYLAPAAGRPFGIKGEPRASCADHLGPGDVLVLYSDGALAGPSVEQGRLRLIEAARAALTAATGTDDACERLLALLTVDQVPEDDLVLLMVHRLADAVRPLRLSVPARPGQLATVRQQLQEWMDDSGVGEQDAVSVQIAIGEAASNVVEHAYPAGQDGELKLAVSITPVGDLVAEVSDNGRWRPPGHASRLRGRGLPLMRACMESMDLTKAGVGLASPAAALPGTRPDVNGTVVRMSRRLRTQVEGGMAAPYGAAATLVPRRPAPQAADFEVISDGDRVLLRFGGVVDLAAVEAIGKRLRAATRGNTLSTTVDLTAVTHLASAGVRLLFELANDGARLGQPVAVLVATGSAVDQVVHLTGLDQVAKVGRQAPGLAK